MNGTINHFPFSDEAPTSSTSSESPNDSRSMMDIRNIVDDSNANTTTRQQETTAAINSGHQQSNGSEPVVVHQITNGSTEYIQLSYGSYGAHPLINFTNDSLAAHHYTNGSTFDGDIDSSNNNTVVEEAAHQQEISLSSTIQQSTLEGIRGENTQEAELVQLEEQIQLQEGIQQQQEQFQPQEADPESEQLAEQQEQPAERQDGEQESSQGTEPEQQPAPAPAPAPAPIEEYLAIRSRHLINATHVDQTPFAHKIDLIADYQDSAVIMSSDEAFGAASNLIKTVAEPPHTNIQPNEENEFRDGWLVKRHEETGYATIRLGVPGTITGIDIDCTGYTQCAPLFASVHGNVRRQTTRWTALVDHVPLMPNAHNFFEVINNTEVHTHAHFTVSPGGGVARLRCYGDIPRPTNMGSREVNMSSSKLGAEIVRKPANIVRGEFPNLIINRKESSQDGWISPRIRGGGAEQSEFTIIKLAGEVEIDRIAVDTVHFIGNAPKMVIIEGCHTAADAATQNGDVDADPFANVEWRNLVADHDILPNTYNSLPCVYDGPITHIRYRPVPNGGVNQILVKGSFYGTRVALPQPHSKFSLGPHKKRKRSDETEPANDENDNRRKSTRVRRPVTRYQ